MVSKVEFQLPLGFNSEVESYLYPRFNLGQWPTLSCEGQGLAQFTWDCARFQERTSPYFLTSAPIASFSERNEALCSPLLVNDLHNIIWTEMFLVESFDPILWFCKILQPLSSINRDAQNVEIAKILSPP